MAAIDAIDLDIEDATDKFFTDQRRASDFDSMANGIWEWMKIYQARREDMLEAREWLNPDKAHIGSRCCKKIYKTS